MTSRDRLRMRIFDVGGLSVLLTLTAAGMFESTWGEVAEAIARASQWHWRPE